MKSKIFAFLFLVFSFTVKAQVIYGLINPFNCSHCNLLAKPLKDAAIGDIEFVFDAENNTKLQANTFIYELTKKEHITKLDAGLFKLLAAATPNEAFPYIYYFDTTLQKVTQVTTCDSFDFYHDKWLLFSNIKGHKKQLYFNSLAKLYGYKVMEASKQWVSVFSYQKPDRIFIINTQTNTIDSLMVTDKFFTKLFKDRGIKEPYLEAKKRASDDVPFVEFSFDPKFRGDTLIATLIIFYYAPNQQSDTITSVIYSQILAYHLPTKTVAVYPYQSFDYCDDKDSDDPNLWYVTDNGVAYPTTNNKLVISLDKDLKNSPTKLKLLMELEWNKTTKQFAYKGKLLDSIALPSATFRGNNLNKTSSFFSYTCNNDVFYYNDAPVFMDRGFNKTHNVLTINPKVTWISDVFATKDFLYLLVYDSNSFESLLKLDRHSGKLVDEKKLFLCEANNATNSYLKLNTVMVENDMRMNENEVVFLDKDGNLNIYPWRRF